MASSDENNKCIDGEDMENKNPNNNNEYMNDGIDDDDINDHIDNYADEDEHDEIVDDFIKRLDESLADVDIDDDETLQFLTTNNRSTTRTSSSCFCSYLKMTGKTILIGTLAVVSFLAFLGSPLVLVNKKSAAMLEFADFPGKASNNLGDVTDAMNEADTALYWHIPKAGGSSMKAYYSCMGLVEATSGSEQRGHDHDETLQVWGLDHKYVNVDTTKEEGILRAKNLKLAESELADIAFTMFPGAAVDMFTPQHKGRPFVLFRHPVDRAVSSFYYRQIATWEKGKGVYDPNLANIGIDTWFEQQASSKENGGFMVSLLLNKSRTEPITDDDMTLAKRILRDKFLIGLVTNMEESVDRFDRYFGWLENEQRSKCLESFIREGTNRNPHEKVEEGSDTWNIAVEANAFDVELYEYAVGLFEEQGNFIFG